MHAIATRHAPAPRLWESIPLEMIVSVFAVILAGGLRLASLMP